MTKEFKIVNSFKGIGEPYRSIWFIGIEEAGVWNAHPGEDRQKYEEYSTGHFCCSCENDPSKIYVTISKIIVGFDNWKNFRDHLLFQKGTPIFQANLFPLGKPTTKFNDWPNHYSKLFGYSHQDIHAYNSTVKDTRFRLLYDFWSRNEPLATVCFGKSYWNDFRELLCISKKDGTNYPNYPFELYQKHKIVLIPFFGYGHMSNVRINVLRNILLEWKIKLNYA